MIITIAGKAGSGKSSVAKELAKRLKLTHHSMGDFMGELAIEKGVSLLEISKLAETSEEIDREIDEKQKLLGKKEDNFVIDSRLGFHFIPQSIKIFLDVEPKVAAKRIFKDEREDEKDNTSLEATEANISKRIESERKRYEQYYGLDHYNPTHYDLLLDTTEDSVEDTVKKILKYIEREA